MFDENDTPPAEATALQRARGRAAVGLVADAGTMRLTGLHQSGAAKAFLPKIHAPVPEVVFLNTAGGLTGGDQLSYALDLGPGARAVATTQTAERAYAAGGARARLTVSLKLGEGAHVDWLPQETILYDRSGLVRQTRIEMAPGATAVMAEMIVLGRAAMGEEVRELTLSDRREIWRGAEPVIVDPFALTTACLGQRPALLGGARAVATLALVAPGAEDAAGALRAALAGTAAECAVSGWDGRCLVRIRAEDGLPLKRAAARALEVMRGGAPLPRVWQI